jgi:general secretion pathway protein K
MARYRGGAVARPSVTRRAPRQQGFALLIVLWSLALLALLGSQILATARQDARIAGNLLESAELEAAANGAIQQAIYRVLDRTNRHWNSDGITRTVWIGRTPVAVRVEDEADKVNPNIASADLLQALLRQVGVDAATAAGIAGSVVEWRLAGGGPGRSNPLLARYVAAGRDYAPSGAPFASADELGAVLGMTPDILARLRPHLTVFTEDDPTPATRDVVVSQALATLGQHAFDAENVGAALVSITADAQAGYRSRYSARVAIRTNARPEGRRYDVLAYERLSNDQP